MSALLLLTGCHKAANIPEPPYSQEAASVPEPPEKSGFTAIIASDIHYLSPSLHDDGEAYQKFASARDGKEIRYIDEITDAFIAEVRAQKPDVLIISGDLTVNGERESHIGLAEKLRLVSSDGIRVLVIPGNHDINNVFARGFSGASQYKTPYVSDSEFAKIYDGFGFGASKTRDTDSLSYLAAVTDDFWLIMMDTCKYKNNVSMDTSQVSGGVSPVTYEWLERVKKLAVDSGAKLAVVQHHNLIDHHELIYEGFTIDGNLKLINTYKSMGVPAVFSGHIHAQEISEYEGIYDVASGALSVYPQRYGRLTVTGDSFSYSTDSVDVEAHARSRNLTDANLLGYKNFSRDWFMGALDRGSVFQFEGVSDVERAEMLDALKEMNLRYFSGEPRTDMAGTQAVELLLRQEGFISQYVESMLKDFGVDDNRLELEL